MQEAAAQAVRAARAVALSAAEVAEPEVAEPEAVRWVEAEVEARSRR